MKVLKKKSAELYKQQAEDIFEEENYLLSQQPTINIKSSRSSITNRLEVLKYAAVKSDTYRYYVYHLFYVVTLGNYNKSLYRFGKP